jgi:thioesterase domain-containing protein
LKVFQEFEKRVIDVKLAVNHPDSFRRMKASSFARKKGNIQRWFGFDKEHHEPDQFQTIEKIRKINHKAMDEYVLSYYDDEIIVLKAKIKTFFVWEREYYGWKPYAKSVIAVDVEGDHNSMVLDPVLKIGFSSRLQELMDFK